MTPGYTLGTLLQAWRLGWRVLKGTGLWFRMTPLCPTELLCELVPVGLDLPRDRGGGSYVAWWEPNDKDPEPEPVPEDLVDRFYVLRQLQPITTYTAFKLREPEGDLIEGSVRNIFEPIPRISKKERVDQALPTPRPSLRFRVLARDNFRCQYCGRTPAETELQVDHVLPRSKGGQTVFGNLVTSCRECNIGKGAMLLEAVPA